MERIRLPSPIFTFQAAPNEPPRKVDCFPFADRKTLWADYLGRPLLFNPEMRQLDFMPCLNKPKSMPLSLFVPNAEADDDYDHYCRGSSLFVMERAPGPEHNWSTPWSDQFEAFVYCKPTSLPFTKSWLWQLLPPPPYVREVKHWRSGARPEISSYALLGSHICISVSGVGTYCLDTASHTWRKAGNWTLPFHGKVEYVPELKLWFGFTTEARHLAAADLSSAMDMGSQPQLVTGSWKNELYLPEEWKERNDSLLVNLGSGRFCVVRFADIRNCLLWICQAEAFPLLFVYLYQEV
ncbi:hypothetical protein E2562_028965 [Oryza meyeriana var. granulata]|uniref:F-box associated domain-containing protein n=1 Tax=Oryza meyeriana var. granulata TaxID=110450 RepID=A0A6G1DS39_9ORYZ|nr:hypothetical protein E2562_028965 [Oryza meyeriana var. granulata]